VQTTHPHSLLPYTMIHSALRIGRVARAQRQRQQQARRHHHHHHRQPQAEPVLGPYDIWEQGEDNEWCPPHRWVTRFSSAEERDAYLAEKRARCEAEWRREQETYTRWAAERNAAEAHAQAEQARRQAEAEAEQARRQAEAEAEKERIRAMQEAAEVAENEAAAKAGCYGRICLRIKRAWHNAFKNI
jgi:hypothetical protein